MNLSRGRETRLDPAGLRLPVVALIDVVFFLLFYFIIAGTLAAEEAELSGTLAVQGGGSSGSPLSPQLVSVEPEGGRVVFRIGARTLPDRGGLLAALRELPKDPGVVIQANDRVDVESVATAMQMAHDAGFTKVTFAPSER
ncbi:MAG: biopolymer transporter ExbD [Phycisphaerales bacterium]